MQRFNNRIQASADMMDDGSDEDISMDLDAFGFVASAPDVNLDFDDEFSDIASFSTVHRTVSEDSVMGHRAGPFSFLPAPIIPEPISDTPAPTATSSLGSAQLKKLSEMSSTQLNLRAGAMNIPIPHFKGSEISGTTPPAGDNFMDEDDDTFMPPSQSPVGSFSQESMHLRENFNSSPSRYIAGSVTFRGNRPPTPSNVAPSPPHSSRTRASAFSTPDGLFVLPDQNTDAIEMNRRMRDEQMWMQDQAAAAPPVRQPQPIYRDGHGNPMQRRAPLLSTRNRPSGSAMSMAPASGMANQSTITRCQSMPTTDMERFFAKEKDPLPLVRKANHGRNEITPATMVDLMNGVYQEQFNDFYIIDCRYPYEFEGGHIKGAMPMPPHESEQALLNHFMNNQKLHGAKIAIIFHCEFSSKRGPAAYDMLRDMDRKANARFYPKTFFKHIYLLKDGYKEFYHRQPKYCEPMAYREMKDSNYSAELKLYKSLENRSKRQRSLSQSMNRLTTQNGTPTSGRCLSRSQTVSTNLRDGVRRSGSFITARVTARGRRQRTRTRQGSNLTARFERM